MRGKIRFTILCNEPERQQLAELANCLGRTQGETIRWVIRKVDRDVGDPNIDQTQQGGEAS